VDRYRLQTALFNLVQNAAEAMPEGGEIVVTAFAEQDHHTVAISVKDNAPAFPQS